MWVLERMCRLESASKGGMEGKDLRTRKGERDVGREGKGPWKERFCFLREKR